MTETIKLALIFLLAIIALLQVREREATLAYATELELYMESKGLEVPDQATLTACAKKWEAEHER